jgi:hydroxyacylglutathione hydrolase
MRVLPVPCLSDNYAYLVVCDVTGEAAIVDPSTLDDTRAAIEAEARAGARLVEIWATHHHGDHVGGLVGVRDAFRIARVRAFADPRIEGVTHPLGDGDTFSLGAIRVTAMHVPGHTRTAIAFFCEDGGDAPGVLTGDTLFAAGCGRLFEGTPGDMHASLSKLAALPPETRVYPGHEYTVSNLVFAATLEPASRDIAAALERARGLRARGEPTVPTTIAEERRTNPFVRVHEPSLRAGLGLPDGSDPVSVLASARRRKDVFVAP